ncbi:conserved hypothetical protein [Ureaplasma urealyticum serovar 10 str. ATCC 33699]|uniref:Uncharacterized protein n=1 Tax=Ureaplasma urealyticum serovar 10 (strain ATCC 33699 / Western) TaxID=565575 RepID=B5ZBK6_UREU1|nr:hypothetical protein [Ureaplasma urealyticum]ACI60108.1 conserved hypothetical protein [Ureaplasma urealyticum serovar 10 str. ATCC 33699]
MAMLCMCDECQAIINYYVVQIEQLCNEIVKTRKRVEPYKKLGKLFFEIIKNDLFEAIAEEVFRIDEKPKRKTNKRVCK